MEYLIVMKNMWSTCWRASHSVEEACILETHILQDHTYITGTYIYHRKKHILQEHTYITGTYIHNRNIHISQEHTYITGKNIYYRNIHIYVYICGQHVGEHFIVLKKRVF